MQRREHLESLIRGTLSKELAETDWQKMLGAAELGRELESDGSAHAMGVAALMHLSDIVAKTATPMVKTLNSNWVKRENKAIAFDRLKELLDRGIKIGAALASLPANGTQFPDDGPKANPSFARGQQVAAPNVNLQFNVNPPTLSPTYEPTMGPKPGTCNAAGQPPDQPAVGAQTS